MNLNNDIKNGTLFPYVKSVGVYHCSEDKTMVKTSTGAPVPRMRCFSMSCFMHGGNGNTPEPGALTKLNSVPHPSHTLVFIDEDDSTLDDGYFYYDSLGNTTWINVPGFRHSKGTVLSYADGSAAFHKWQGSLPAPGSAPAAGPGRADFIWLNSTSPQDPNN